MKINKKGFTLVELLVVVLIIGILAAIAVPQYQLATRKAEFAGLKAKTKAIAQAANLYYLTNNKYANNFKDLDLSFGDVSKYKNDETHGYIYFKNGYLCSMWANGWTKIHCQEAKNGMRYYFDFITLKQYECYFKKDDNIGHKVCYQETGGKDGGCNDNENFCRYYY